MSGTIIITGANGSLAIPAVEYLIVNYPQYDAVLAVRDTSDADLNTQKLRKTLAKHPGAKALIRKLDLANLSDVHTFASTIIAEIADGKTKPIASIICNAYYWNLVGEAEITRDGYEKSLQVTHISHAALILRLLGSFGSDGGRVVLFSSDATFPGKNGLEKYPPTIPNDFGLLVKPAVDKKSDVFGRGFQRYAVSKLVVVMWMYALNRYLEKDPKLGNITAVAINPGNLSDSRALRTNTPRMIVILSWLVIRPLRFLLRFIDPTMRTVAEASADVVNLATNNAHPNDRGYFTLLKKDTSSPDSMEEGTQQKLWSSTLEWARITPESTALTPAFE